MSRAQCEHEHVLKLCGSKRRKDSKSTSAAKEMFKLRFNFRRVQCKYFASVYIPLAFGLQSEREG